MGFESMTGMDRMIGLDRIGVGLDWFGYRLHWIGLRMESSWIGLDRIGAC